MRHWWVVIILLFSFVFPVKADSISNINVSGGGTDPTLTVSFLLTASSKHQQTNVTVQLLEPSGNVVATTSMNPPPLDAGESWQGQWSLSSSMFPHNGNYTAIVCWSPGASPNCQISRVSVIFTPANSLDVLLVVLLAFFVFMFLRRERRTSP